MYPARVVANHDPHNQGRVRVRYCWQEDGETTWVRLLSAHAGAGRGFLFLPELGDEVLIAFEEGDAERPYVVGSAWNGVHQPPAAGFHAPGEMNGSEFAPNDIKRLVTKSGHRITMVDTPGRETISVSTPRSARLMLTEQHQDTGRPAIVLESAGDMILAAPNGRIHSQAKFHSRDVGVNGVPQLTPAAYPAPAKPGAATPLPLAAPPAAKTDANKDSDYDGCLIGKGCAPLTQKQKPGERLSDNQIKDSWNSAYSSSSPCCQARRAAGQAPKKIVYVNGIRTTKQQQCDTLKAIANQSCAQVIGVHNSTDGTLGDLLQSREDKSLIDQANAGKQVPTHDGRNPAVDSLDDVIANSVRDGDPPQIWAHSQGGAITSLASYDANSELKRAGFRQGISGLQVNSFGSAAQSWPSSITANHFINLRDLTPVWKGLGKTPSSDLANTGPNQHIYRFEGSPDDPSPQFLTDKQIANMQHVYVEDDQDRHPFHYEDRSPNVSMSAYHDMNTTYLNAARSKQGGCS